MDHHDHSPIEPPAALRSFIEAAQRQPIVETCVTAEAVAAGLEHQRRRAQSRRVVVLSAGMAAAASLIVVALAWPLLSSREVEGPSSVHERRVVEATTAEQADTPRQLAHAVRLRSSTEVEVRGPWSIALRDGVHEIDVDPVAGHALRIALPQRELELVEGRLSIEFVDGDLGGVAVRLQTGVAAWVDEHGERSQISVERTDLELAGEPDASVAEPDPTVNRPSVPTAVELARAAEDELAAGHRDQAIAIYQQLVRKHPRATQTRAAVLDLARLLRTHGRKDEARCAYRLYLERWPDSAVRAEVESQLDRLGRGPDCRGLRPL